MLICYCIEAIKCNEECRHKIFHVLSDKCVDIKDCKLGKYPICCPDTASFDYCHKDTITCEVFR